MKRNITYVSELGNEFNTPEKAIADDDRIPEMISVYESDIKKYREFKNPPDEILEDISMWENELADLKCKWERALRSKEYFYMKEFN